ncbi:MAG: lipopolysaccharide biosynthesis protein [Clostridiales bacterium]|nr:lipopolysaccharide biosynthesis protein [Clostridiales bacterium]
MADSNKRTIARNTVFLYSRLILIMLVSLYTSRVTLKVLGVDDYGIYQTVGGVVSFLAFLSNALATGTSRFITFEMGKEKPRLSELFATVRVAHIFLASVIVVAGEVIGLWFIYNKLVIPPERLSAAVFTFHFSMAATFLKITQVPYNSTLIAHERMNVYAYISLLEAGLKLLLVFLLNVILFDKLEVYAVLMCATTVTVLVTYRIYCRRKFPETRAKLSFDRELFKGVASFSGWSLFSSSASALANQGVTVVTDMFFEPAVVTLRSLALNINTVLNDFMSSFRTAVNPQIVKKYAAGDLDGSKRLALTSTQYTYYLMLLIVMPLFLLTEPALNIWLDEVPDGLIPFVRLALIQGLFQSIDTSLYAAIYAKGRIRENAVISPLLDFIQLPVIYALFMLGFPPVTLAWVAAACYAVLAFIVKPLLVRFIAGYEYGAVMGMLGKCMVITVVSAVIPVVSSILLDENTIAGFIIILMVSLISVSAVVWTVGLDRGMRSLITRWLKELMSKKRKW